MDFFFALVCGTGFGFWFWEGARDDVGEPVTQATGCSINGCMGRINGDAFEGEAEEGLLLGVC